MTMMRLSNRLISKGMLRYVLDFLVVECGDRLKDLGDDALCENGVMWDTVGCYRFLFNEQRWATTLLHLPAGASAKFPEHENVHAKFCISRNWSDFEAIVKKHPQDLVLHTYFGKNAGPHKVMPVTENSPLMRAALDYAEQKVR